MKTLEVNGAIYRTRMLDAFTQFHVGRRLAPLLAVSGASAGGLIRSQAEQAAATGKPLDDIMNAETFMPLLPLMAEVLSRMPEDDCNYVLKHCLQVVDRQVSEGAWQCLSTPDGQLMYQDLQMPTMVRLVWEVVQDNLGGFLKGLGVEASSPSPSGSPK